MVLSYEDKQQIKKALHDYANNGANEIEILVLVERICREKIGTKASGVSKDELIAEIELMVKKHIESFQTYSSITVEEAERERKAEENIRRQNIATQALIGILSCTIDFDFVKDAPIHERQNKRVELAFQYADKILSTQK